MMCSSDQYLSNNIFYENDYTIDESTSSKFVLEIVFFIVVFAVLLLMSLFILVLVTRKYDNPKICVC